jgi:hypothetical protein
MKSDKGGQLTMAGPKFFQTGMGRAFYERDIPRLVTALESIADKLDRINELLNQYKREDSDHETTDQKTT